MTEHTPGPWISVPHLDEFDIFDAPGANRICGYVTTKQNAALIAAAPEMLAAMKSADKWLSKAEPSFAIEQARGFLEQVIAKAEGRDE